MEARMVMGRQLYHPGHARYLATDAVLHARYRATGYALRKQYDMRSTWYGRGTACVVVTYP
eukprot:2518308-Rhodomonas_salina.1